MRSFRSHLLSLLDWVLIGFGFWIIDQSGLSIGGDAGRRYESLDRLLSEGTLDTGSYSYAGPILAAPLWWLAGDDPELRKANVVYFNLLIFGLAAIAMHRMLRRAIGPVQSRMFVLALLLASGFPHELRNFNNEVLSAVGVGCGLLALSKLASGVRLLPSAGLIVSAINMPGIVIGSGLGLARMILHRKQLRWGVIGVLCVLGIWGESWLVRGSPFVSGYENNAGFKTSLPYSGLPGFSYPFLLGVISILFSFGKGLIFFYPALFAPARRWIASRELSAVYESWLLVVVGLVAVYSRWWSWYGGWCWGPRFFLFAALPAALALALWVEHARTAPSALAAIVVAALSFWVGYCGLVYNLETLDLCVKKKYIFEPFCWYVPEYSVLVRPIIDGRALEEWEIQAAWIFGAAFLRISGPAWYTVLVRSVVTLGGQVQRGVGALRALRL